MDCDVCSVCHSHIDYGRLDRAYPHLCGEPAALPECLSPLEESIYWGEICLECARAAETEPPERPRFRTFPPPRPSVPAPPPGSAPPESV